VGAHLHHVSMFQGPAPNSVTETFLWPDQGLWASVK